MREIQEEARELRENRKNKVERLLAKRPQNGIIQNQKKIERTKDDYESELDNLVKRVHKILNAVTTRQRTTINKEYTIRDGEVYIYGNSRVVDSIDGLIGVLDEISKDDLKGDDDRYKVVKKLKSKLSSIKKPCEPDFVIESEQDGIETVKVSKRYHHLRVRFTFDSKERCFTMGKHDANSKRVRLDLSSTKPELDHIRELDNIEPLLMFYNDIIREQKRRYKHNTEQKDKIQEVTQEIKDEGIAQGFLVKSFLK